MNKYLIKLIYICLWLMHSSYGQFSKLGGGRTDLAFSNVMLLEGSSVKSSRAGVSANYGGVAALHGNPAGLFNQKGFYVQADMILPWLQAKVSTNGILQDPFKASFDAALEGMDNPPEGEDREYPELNGQYGSAGGPVGGGVFYHKDLWDLSFCAGIGFSVLSDFSYDLNLDDVVTKIAYPFDDTKEGSDSLRAYFEMALTNRFRLSLVEQSIALGVEIPWSKPLRTGLSIHRYSSDYLAELYLTGDFLAARNGLLYEFNSPDALWTDSLFMDYYGIGSGSGYGSSLGLSWQFLRWMSVDFLWEHNGAIRFEGLFDGVGYKLYAMDLLGDEPFNAGDINASKISLTQYNHHQVDQVEMNLGSRVGAALSFFWKEKNRINLSYAYVYDPPSFSFHYNYERTFLDTATKEVVQNIKGDDSLLISTNTLKFQPSYSHYLHLGLEINNIHVFAGLQFWHGLEMHIGDRVRKLGDQLPILPSVGLGYEWNLGPRVSIDFSAFTLPEPLFKTSLRYLL